MAGALMQQNHIKNFWLKGILTVGYGMNVLLTPLLTSVGVRVCTLEAVCSLVTPYSDSHG